MRVEAETVLWNWFPPVTFTWVPGVDVRSSGRVRVNKLPLQAESSTQPRSEPLIHPVSAVPDSMRGPYVERIVQNLRPGKWVQNISEAQQELVPKLS